VLALDGSLMYFTRLELHSKAGLSNAHFVFSMAQFHGEILQLQRQARCRRLVQGVHLWSHS
jgi:hypothetical protein